MKMQNNSGRIINSNEIINDNKGVVERWEEFGFLNGIEEGDKKYLADLYDSLADELLTTFNYDKFGENIGFEKLSKINGIEDTMNYSFNTTESLHYFAETSLFAIIRSVYSKNKTFSINEFMECLYSVVIDDAFYNNVNGYLETHDNDTIDVAAELTIAISNNILNMLNEDNNE